MKLRPCSNNNNGNQDLAQPASVVTGTGRFLGLHLTDLLLARGHKVIDINNFVTGAVDNIAHLGGNPNLKFIKQDVTEFILLDVSVNYVWHFASPMQPVFVDPEGKSALSRCCVQ